MKKLSYGENTYILPKSKFDNYDFSFSGVKTHVLNVVNKEKDNLRINDMCKSFETNVVEVLVENTLRAMKDFNVSKVVLAGGVSANTFLREYLASECNKLNYLVYLPDLEYCTDNAAMICSAAYYNYISKDKDKFNILDNLNLNAVANLKIGG